MAVPLFLPHDDHARLPLNKHERLLEALEVIVKSYPPQTSWGPPLKGLWNGPTAIAYLFLRVSAAQPALQIASRSALQWAEAYLDGTRDPPSMLLEPRIRCGISSEALVFPAVQASISRDLAHVGTFLENVNTVLESKSEAEWHSGRAGLLYLIRMVHYWVPEAGHMLDVPAARLRKSIVGDGPDWKFRGTRYIGAAHGDIGTLTQVALSSPTESELLELEEWLVRLLSWQKADGNWAVNEQVDPRPYVQFCHGAPGFVQSLRSIRHLFPELQDSISQAISRANKLVWKEGMLKKEPNLCHGSFGNCLTLTSTQKDVFLAASTPESVAEARRLDATQVEKADYGFEYSLYTGYWPGAAWAWLSSDDEEGRLIGYNDV